jgi:hypothetical protein
MVRLWPAILGRVAGCTFFPVHWEKGDGSIVRLVAIVEEEDKKTATHLIEVNP